MIGKLSEVNIKDEAGLSQRSRVDLLDGGNVERFENRIEADLVAIPHCVREVYRNAVDEYEIDLRLRDSEQLERLANRGLFGELLLERYALMPWRQVIVQLGVETERDARHDKRTVNSKRSES
jgi:hypothetical protein